MSSDSDSSSYFDSYLLPILQFIHDELKDDSTNRERKAETSHDRKRNKKYINQEREAGHDRLFNDYFSNEPVYTDQMFRKRFRMSKELFLQIIEALSNHSEYFQMKHDAYGRDGLSPLQKCTDVIRQLENGSPADHCDEVYLRRPNANDVQRLLQLHSNYHDFPGMLESIDGMHWPWKNCPVAWKGQFTRGDQGVPTIMLESVASQHLWIWHTFFGVARFNNDINVLNQSPFFNDVLQGYSAEILFTVNDTQYTKGYYLEDGIYPEWASFVKNFAYPEYPKRIKFNKCKRLQGRTLNEHSGSSNLAGQ